ncbi:hypothetical protein B0T22DRAFT_432377 [Podospora appendiculata]|uniref:DUF3492 domain-containing protein n=1 Tax=Podospora appendiculata TaxID=314037 RepID=A0AAE0X0D2_9PEZI|nr:hypothetical protein B0T22DRAFT_432377 [Podospora appendiculata]
MASFFQVPISGDPVIAACNPDTNTTGSDRRIYCNRLLAPDKRLQTPLQYFTLVLAATCLAVPLLIWLGTRTTRLVRKGWRNGKRTKKGSCFGKRRKWGSVSFSPIDFKLLSAVRSFRFIGNGHDVFLHVREQAHPDGEMLVVPLPSFPDAQSNLSPSPTPASQTKQPLLAGLLDIRASSQTSLPSLTNHLSSLVNKNGVVSAIVLRARAVGLADHKDEYEAVHNLLWRLHQQRAPVLLNCHHDDPAFEHVDFSLLVGVIIDNACILPDGNRRDYFRSQRLRDIMARCAQERAERPGFFVGFHDVWDQQPSAAVVCRAEKLATHFEAAFEHGPCRNTGTDVSQTHQERLPRSTSGFEFLRKPETAQVHTAWIQQRRKVHIGPCVRVDDEIACLDLTKLQPLLPNIDNLLSASPLPGHADRESNPSEELQLIIPPDYRDLAPPRPDFWDFSANGDEISSLGCIPLTVSANPSQYEAVLATQIHLRDLQILHRIEEIETNKLVEQLNEFGPSVRHSHLIATLVQGLVQQKVVVYKGLATGFSLPDHAVQFWGVSGSHEAESGGVDIFISRSCPSDIGTVLHTWLAHHGVSRVMRYEDEQRFEQVSSRNRSLALPLSIRAAIDQATPGEALFLLQQLYVARIHHPLTDAIEDHCTKALLDDTSAASWNDAHSRRFLEGSVSINELFRQRLAHFTRLGAIRLPLEENLTQLYGSVESLISSALFSGDSETIVTLCDALMHAYDPDNCWTDCEFVDINTDLFALIFFCALRKAALEDVYIEATDHCPFFSSQPDQAAVFSELWVLGSQCELFFGLPPRALGKIVYDRYRAFFREHPPPTNLQTGKSGLMAVYAKPEPASEPSETGPQGLARKGLSNYAAMHHIRKTFVKFGVISIFCLPAMIDILQLTFVGRGLFMTAYMGDDNLGAACFGLLLSLLLSAGVTGWVGSVGNYYLCNYAYNNMVYFHVQRLSGGFILSFLVAVVGTIIFCIKTSVGPAFVFFAYLMLISTYLNVLGIMATMYQQGSPLTSGRTVLWRTIPILFLSPLISTFLDGHDLLVYLTVGYGYLFLVLFQYRRLCQEWVGWIHHVPSIAEDDIVSWYTAKLKQQQPTTSSSQSSLRTISDDSPEVHRKLALRSFSETVALYRQRLFNVNIKRLCPGTASDHFVQRVGNGLRYIDWLLQIENRDKEPVETFSVAWFAQLTEAMKSRRQMAQGLKEHSIFMLFRYARFDIGQNIGLFLIILMDRWVSIAMAANAPQISLFSDFTSRYAICFAILFFCCSVMTLDVTLEKYWKVNYELSEDKLSDYDDAISVARNWERYRQKNYLIALFQLARRVLFIFGCSTLFVWLLVDNVDMLGLYFLYVLGYSSVIMFQFNRCFTTNIQYHVTSILGSAATGFVTGCALHAIYTQDPIIYLDVIALDVAGIVAALSTSIWAWRNTNAMPVPENLSAHPKTKVWTQRRMTETEDLPVAPGAPLWKSLPGSLVSIGEATSASQEISDLLQSGKEQHAASTAIPSWSSTLFNTALEMWIGNQIHVIACPRSAFMDGGLNDIASYSKLEADVLHVTVGILGEMEAGMLSWQPVSIRVVCESILFHTARAVLGLTSAQAVEAEHLLPGCNLLSSRIALQIATEDVFGLSVMRRHTNTKVLKHLCLDINPDSNWDSLDLFVREAIVSRVVGKHLWLTPELCEWMRANDADLQTSDFHIKLCLEIHKQSDKRLAIKMQNSNLERHSTLPLASQQPFQPYVHGNFITEDQGSVERLRQTLGGLPLNITKWTAIISGAGSNIERELWYAFRHHTQVRGFFMWFLLLVWRGCWHMKNAWIYAMLIYQHNALVTISRLAKKGASRTLHKNSIIVEIQRKTITGFASKLEDDSLVLEIYDGHLLERPSDLKPASTAVYDENCRLVSRRDKTQTQEIITTYTHTEPHTRYPVIKHVYDGNVHRHCFYDKIGRVSRGTVKFGSTAYLFHYFYKSGSKGSHEILKAEFRLSHSYSAGCLTVCWGVPLRDDFSDDCDWVPSNRVCRVIREMGSKTYVTTSDYRHRRDPVMMTVLEENDTKAAVIRAPRLFDHEEVLLQRPSDVSYENDDLLLYHGKSHIQRMARFAGRKMAWTSLFDPTAWSYWQKQSVFRRVPTWWLRTELWDHWRKKGDMDAIAACWMDELILREEPLLKQYWAARGAGQLSTAMEALDSRIEQVVAAVEIEQDVSEVCMLPIKASDLYAMGLGKDATQVTTRPQDCFNDTRDRISVIFNDIGCWPESPGGVSNCRRDLVNGHSTIRNHVLAESANDYGIARFQVEKNVQSLKVIPLWGLDDKTPSHGVITNLLESEVDIKIANTRTRRDIAGKFVPLLKLFVKGARSRHISRPDLIRYSNAMLAIFAYFEHKDYNKTWNSKVVASAWVEAWLTKYDDANINDPADSFELERPSMSDFRSALAIYTSYFFIFSVQTPEECPKVFQSTHHGLSSLFGMLLKHRRGATFGIWDHAILWRECCLNISPAQSSLPIPVQSMILSGINLAMRLAYFHADVVLPCTPVFNPVWEADLGTDGNRVEHSKKFSRKIDPIVNGVSNMEAFQPVDEVRTKTPTVVMLSNVQFIKDIKTAIRAADVIINQYGFQDYRLLIYGARDREPHYAIDMAKLIESCRLTDRVILKGFGKPQEILKEAWLFMNSSLSEGLPLAVAEAALAGVPIVATAVGATALVLTDPEDPSICYGEVVPPNDPTALARAQIAMLAMAGPWAKFAGDVDKRGSVLPGLLMPNSLTPHDVSWLSKRMYEKSDARRYLGMLSRQVVLRGFHGKRYLREHEQMYWIQWHLAHMRKDISLVPGWSPPISPIPETDGVDGSHAEGPAGTSEGLARNKSFRWQEFSSPSRGQKPPHRIRSRRKRLSKVRDKGEVSGVVEV